MDAVTYPDSKVARTISEEFVPVKLTITDETPEVKDAMKHYTLLWTPTLVFLDEQGKELRRSVGYLSPEEMVPELIMAAAAYDLTKDSFAKAFDRFERVKNEYGQSMRAPEAMYWSAMAAYKRDDNVEKLLTGWHELRDRYPDSSWWQKAAFIDKK